MDYQTALNEFATLLEVASGSLLEIVAKSPASCAAAKSQEIAEIADRLRAIGEEIGEALLP